MNFDKTNDFLNFFQRILIILFIILFSITLFYVPHKKTDEFNKENYEYVYEPFWTSDYSID
jgi:uncharacterized membrane protein